MISHLSGKLVSLLELLRFYSHLYVELAKVIQEAEIKLSSLDEKLIIDMPHDADQLAKTQRFMASVGNMCDRIGLKVSSMTAKELSERAPMKRITSSDLGELHRTINRELSTCLFLKVDRISDFENSLAGWEFVLTHFKQASSDIEEMNKCYALCRYPAAAFHALSVAEHGIVDLGREIGVNDPKEGWDATFKKLNSIMKAGRNSNTTGLDFTFLEQINNRIETMKHAWRNRVDHVSGRPIVFQGDVPHYVADEIRTAVHGFMRTLSEEKEKRVK